VQVNDPNRRAPGQGNLAFAPILEALKRGRYEGVLAVEAFDYVPDGMGAAAWRLPTCAGWPRAPALRHCFLSEPKRSRYAMSTAPQFSIAPSNCSSGTVTLRLPFRFGVVTLSHCRRPSVRAAHRHRRRPRHHRRRRRDDGAKWFDKIRPVQREQLRPAARGIAPCARCLSADNLIPATRLRPLRAPIKIFFFFTHPPRIACAAKGYNPLLANYGPALIDRAIWMRCAAPMAPSFLPGTAKEPAGDRKTNEGEGRRNSPASTSGAFLSRLPRRKAIEARHTVGMVDAISAADLAEPV